jgi:membrane fusion protein (multidrug efflux system)
MITRLLTLLLLMPLLLLGCGQKVDKKPPPPPIKVGVVTARTGDLVQTLEVSGTLHFVANTVVSSEVAAQVSSLAVRDGQPVQQGQVLLKFDDSTIRAAADQARGNLQKDQATLAYNKAEWEKNLPLLKSGAISQSAYDQKFSLYQTSLGQVEGDKAALTKALEDLKHTVVKAPIAGLLSDRYIEKGDWVSTGGKLFQISDYSVVYLETFLTDREVAKLNIGKVILEGDGVQAEVRVDSLPQKTFKGRIRYIQPVTNQNQLFQVRIYIDNKSMELFQGMFARAQIAIKRIPNVLRVPIDALLDQIRNGQSNTVVVVDKHQQARVTQVKIGATDEDYAQVVEGLQPGEQIVVEGKEVLVTGQPLQPTGYRHIGREIRQAKSPG